jgi:hypothetical protein
MTDRIEVKSYLTLSLAKDQQAVIRVILVLISSFVEEVIFSEV